MDSKIRKIISLACVFFIIGIVINYVGVEILNDHEEKLSEIDDRWDYIDEKERVNRTKRTSRALILFGNSLTYLSLLIIIIVFSVNIYEKVESIQLEINRLKYHNELEKSSKTKIEKNYHK